MFEIVNAQDLTLIYMKSTCSGIYMKSPKYLQPVNSTDKANYLQKSWLRNAPVLHALENIGTTMSRLHSHDASIFNNGQWNKLLPLKQSDTPLIIATLEKEQHGRIPCGNQIRHTLFRKSSIMLACLVRLFYHPQCSPKLQRDKWNERVENIGDQWSVAWLWLDA